MQVVDSVSSERDSAVAKSSGSGDGCCGSPSGGGTYVSEDTRAVDCSKNSRQAGARWGVRELGERVRADNAGKRGMARETKAEWAGAGRAERSSAETEASTASRSEAHRVRSE